MTIEDPNYAAQMRAVQSQVGGRPLRIQAITVLLAAATKLSLVMEDPAGYLYGVTFALLALGATKEEIREALALDELVAIAIKEAG